MMTNQLAELGTIAGIGVGLYFVVRWCVPNDIQAAVKLIWTRYGKKLDDDRPLTYIHREIDRQINKVRGILTFDGILFVAFRLRMDRELDTYSRILVEVGVVFVLFSIFVSLWLFFVRWGGSSKYRTFETEFEFKAEHIRERTVLVNYSVTMSFISAAMLVGLMAMNNFRL